MTLRRVGDHPLYWRACFHELGAKRRAHAEVLALDVGDDDARNLAVTDSLSRLKTEISSDWADIRAEHGQCISFQQVEGYAPPRWPGQEVPQQMHLDVIVDDLDAAEAAVLDLGATKHEHQPGTSFRVFLDPAGHPFCLCLD